MPTTANFGWTYPTPLDPATADVWGATLNTLFGDVDGEMATRSANYNFADFNLIRPNLIDYGEDVQAISSSSGSLTFNMTSGNHAELTLTENITTFTFSNWSPSGTLSGRVLRIVQDSTARTITWPAAVKWAGGTAPTLSTGSGDVDILVFISFDGGTTIYGSIFGQDFS